MNWLPTRKSGRLQMLVGLAFASELLYLLIATLQAEQLNIPIFLLAYAALFVIYWLVCRMFVVVRHAGYPFSGNKPFAWFNDFLVRHRLQENLSTKEVLTIGIVFGVLFRLTLLFTTPGLSDDIYRYIWDGRVASHGVNPYQYAPEADELAQLRDAEIHPRINHKAIPTVYPPVLQLVFQTFYQLHPTVLMFKVGFLLFDLLTICGLLLILKRLGFDRRQVLVYAWNPLVIVEFAGSGHADIVGILLLTIACYLIMRGKLIGSTLVLVLSFLTKYIAALLLPVIMLLRKESKQVIAILFVIFTGIFYLPFASVGSKLFTGLSVYTAKWENNSSVFGLLRSTLEATIPDAWVVKYYIPRGMTPTPETIETMGTDAALLVAKIIVAVVFAAYMLFCLRRLGDDMQREGPSWIFKLWLRLFGLFLLLGPTVHPWYVCWLVPFLAVQPERPWLLWTGLVTLSYWNLINYAETGIWQESVWVKCVEYLPVYLLLGYDLVRGRVRERRLAGAGRLRLQSH